MTAAVTSPVQQHIYYGEQKLEYQISYLSLGQGKPQIKIHVLPDGKVQIDAPDDTPNKIIKDAVRKRAQWILSNLQVSHDTRSDVLTREYISGESHFYLGRRHVLKVLPVSVLPQREKAEKAKMSRGKIAVYTKNNAKKHVKKILYIWYRQRAGEVFKRNLDNFTKVLPWLQMPPKLNMTPMGTQWGSCSVQGNISLNIHLVKAPSPCIEYVLLHELCHLTHPKYHCRASSQARQRRLRRIIRREL